ncbi:MAG: hypothetical protein L6V93_18270 [Clostridiales bacterium]|nr:MAG: hypothetical protein L6V93_18270 [Clostridiales bacterium]
MSENLVFAYFTEFSMLDKTSSGDIFEFVPHMYGRCCDEQVQTRIFAHF